MNNIENLDKKYSAYLKITGTLFLGLGALLMLVLSISTASGIDSQVSTRTISVSGYAKMDVKPDIRYVTLNITGKGATEKASKDSVAQKSQQAVGLLKTKQISDDDIDNQNLSTYPTYNNKAEYCPKYQTVSSPSAPAGIPRESIYCGQNSVITGYETSQTIQIKLKGDKMDMAGDLVNLLTGDGVTVQTGDATLENPNALKGDVRDLAIADAKKNADKLADALGVRLGKVQSFSENSGGYYPMMNKAVMSRDAMAPEAGSAPVIPDGTETISSDVVVVYEIR